MKLTSLTPIEDRKWWAEFEIDGETVRKLVWVHPAEKLRPGLIYKTIKSLREADRDVAYKRHGDAFRAHCRLQSKYWGSLSEEELSAVDLAPLARELVNLRTDSGR